MCVVAAEVTEQPLPAQALHRPVHSVHSAHGSPGLHSSSSPEPPGLAGRVFDFTLLGDSPKARPCLLSWRPCGDCSAASDDESDDVSLPFPISQKRPSSLLMVIDAMAALFVSMVMQSARGSCSPFCFHGYASLHVGSL